MMNGGTFNIENGKEYVRCCGNTDISYKKRK